MFSSFSSSKKFRLPVAQRSSANFTILPSLFPFVFPFSSVQFNHSRWNWDCDPLRVTFLLWCKIRRGNLKEKLRTKRERERASLRCERCLIYRCYGRRSGRRSAEGWEARLFADVMVATASRSPGSPRGRGRFANRGSPQPRDPLKNESGRVLYVFVTHAFPSIEAHTLQKQTHPSIYPAREFLESLHRRILSIHRVHWHPLIFS